MGHTAAGIMSKRLSNRSISRKSTVSTLTQSSLLKGGISNRVFILNQIASVQSLLSHPLLVLHKLDGFYKNVSLFVRQDVEKHTVLENQCSRAQRTREVNDIARITRFLEVNVFGDGCSAMGPQIFLHRHEHSRHM